MNHKPEPTQQELEAARRRLAELDRLSPLCAWHKDSSQLTAAEKSARSRWYAIMEVQDQFEVKYY